MKDLMGTLSPAYGMMTGHGLFGQNVGALPAIAKSLRDEKDKQYEEFKMKEEAKKSGIGMKKGGKVKSAASKRGDGCAIRGKTKGKMV